MPDVLSAFNALAVSTDAILGDALAPYALFTQQGRMIGEIAIDVPIQELHEDSYTLTQHPVATGTPVSDHYFSNPCRLQMTCGFSDSTAGYQGYSAQVLAAFDALADSRTPFSVSTGKKNYDNMMIEGLSHTTDPQSEFALYLVVRLQEVIVTSTASSGPQGDQAMPATTSPTVDMGQVQLGTVAGPSYAEYIAGYNSPVKTPVGAGGIGSA